MYWQKHNATQSFSSNFSQFKRLRILVVIRSIIYSRPDTITRNENMTCYLTVCIFADWIAINVFKML